MEPIELKWLCGGAHGKTGITWGVPWAKGECRPGAEFVLRGEKGGACPVQTWPLASWPDGSLKWTAHAAEADTAESWHLWEGNATPGTAVKAVRNGKTTEVRNGDLVCRMTEGGKNFWDEVTLGGKTVCLGAEPEALLETRAGSSEGLSVNVRKCPSRVSSVRVIQNGPVRCAVEIRGSHFIPGEDREWLPYTLRLYFYAGDPRIHMVHTFRYSGDPAKDFLKGIGLKFHVPAGGEAYSRFACLGGDTGLFFEPSQILEAWHPRVPQEVSRAQFAGKMPELAGEDGAAVRKAAAAIPIWNDYRLFQDSADHFGIEKRTGEGCCFVHAADGKRAPGLVYAGGEAGGLALGLRDFWQKHPRSLEISNLSAETAAVRVWLYSPQAPAMDLRHYDRRSYVQTYYEGAEEIRSTPCGIANTDELDFFPFSAPAERAALEDCARFLREPPVLVCTPERYHSKGAFGVWSLPDRSTERKAKLEDQLDRLADFYRDEIDRREWYGFWNYGDVMHTYDSARHCWKYDMGGYAWDNTELMSDLTLWYMFLRTGRSDLYTMARAMTRHSSEVDIYHEGQYRGLGSRHNVLHWGDGCKEARIAMAAHDRYLYYMTADERLGEVMCETADADFSTLKLDPMRAYFPKDEFPTHARSGPDWAAFVSNWMTMWERFGYEKYRQKILTGIECLKKMPHRLISGPVFGYDPAGGKLSFFTESPGEHLTISQGEPEVWMELCGLLDDPEWVDMVAEYGRFYMLPPEEKIRKTGLAVKGKGWSFPIFACSMAAFAAKHDNDPALAAQVWKIVENDETLNFRPESVPEGGFLRPMTEIPGVSTNTVSQWAINTIQCLELIGDMM